MSHTYWTALRAASPKKVLIPASSFSHVSGPSSTVRRSPPGRANSIGQVESQSAAKMSSASQQAESRARRRLSRQEEAVSKGARMSPPASPTYAPSSPWASSSTYSAGFGPVPSSPGYASQQTSVSRVQISESPRLGYAAMRSSPTDSSPTSTTHSPPGHSIPSASKQLYEPQVFEGRPTQTSHYFSMLPGSTFGSQQLSQFIETSAFPLGHSLSSTATSLSSVNLGHRVPTAHVSQQPDEPRRKNSVDDLNERLSRLDVSQSATDRRDTTEPETLPMGVPPTFSSTAIEQETARLHEIANKVSQLKEKLSNGLSVEVDFLPTFLDFKFDYTFQSTACLKLLDVTSRNAPIIEAVKSLTALEYDVALVKADGDSNLQRKKSDIYMSIIEQKASIFDWLRDQWWTALSKIPQKVGS
ncbi:hypothetical protein H0H93_005851 [Arthromyces matolae]|nr:hypothetical protein H0H93_005851 [Arthromyces matolae]